MTTKNSAQGILSGSVVRAGPAWSAQIGTHTLFHFQFIQSSHVVCSHLTILYFFADQHCKNKLPNT